jgi:hypothetical protein
MAARRGPLQMSASRWMVMEVLSSRPRNSGWAFITGARSFSRPRATNVLVDGRLGEEAEADHVTGRHHDGVVVGVGGAADHDALDGGAGRAIHDRLLSNLELERICGQAWTDRLATKARSHR